MTDSIPGKRSKNAGYYAALLGSIVLWGLGLWHVVTQRADFAFGGRSTSESENYRAIFVDAEGWDAIAIGVVFIGLGFINFARGIKGRGRIPIFWVGAGLFSASLLYGLVKAGRAVVDLAYHIAA